MNLFKTSQITRLRYEFDHDCVCVQCKEGGFPHDLWLGVSAENVSVYKRGEPKPLETFQYEHIVFFGAPQPSTYKIIVDEREMFFETSQVTKENAPLFLLYSLFLCYQTESCAIDSNHTIKTMTDHHRIKT